MSNSKQGRGIFLVSKLSQVSEWRKGAKWKPDQDPEQKVVLLMRRSLRVLEAGTFIRNISWITKAKEPHLDPLTRIHTVFSLAV